MAIKYTQPDGLRVILEPVASAVSVSAGLWISRGSRDEKPEEYGYAHLTEHMLFKGTEKFTAAQMARMVDRVGGQHNAATDREYTCYYLSLIADHLEMALDILSDMYYRPLFDPEEMEKEKKVVVEEILMCEDTPDEFVHDLFVEHMLKGHPLSHPILGSREIISSSDSVSLRKFYDRNYFNGNAVLVIAGNLDVERTKDLILRYFNSARPVPEQTPSSGSYNIEKVSIKHVHRDIEQIHFCMGLDGIKKSDEDRWALYALSTILGGSMSSRLFQKIREEAGLCYSVYSFHSAFSDCGLFGIYCATGNRNFKKTVDLIMQECRSALKNGFTGEELNDARTFIKGSFALSMESMDVRMGQLARNEITFGREMSFEEFRQKVDAVSMDDLVRVTERIFRDREMSVVSVGRNQDGYCVPVNLAL